jgi:hypothetical protein
MQDAEHRPVGTFNIFGRASDIAELRRGRELREITRRDLDMAVVSDTCQTRAMHA